MKNIVLTGFMASGKTTVGNLISEITGMDFADTDLMIEEKSGISINEIFEKYGLLPECIADRIKEKYHG